MVDPSTLPQYAYWFMAGWPEDLPTPSSWQRVAECPRSEALPHTLQAESRDAHMGTVAHAYLADCLTIGKDQALERAPAEERDWLEALDIDRLPLTQGEFWAETSVAYDLQTGQARVLGHNLTREQARGLKTPSEVVGTMDLAAGDAGPDTVFVGDWKTGFGHVPPAAENWQTKGYALMLARALGKKQAVTSIIRVRTDGSPPWHDTAQLDEDQLTLFEIRLLQMFAERTRVRSLTRKAFAADTPREQAAYLEGLPPLKEGPWCKYCPAKNACPARVGAMALAFGDTGAPLNLTEDKAARYWPALDVVKHTRERWLGILEDFARETPFHLGNGVWVGPITDRKREGDIVPDVARQTLVKMFGELGSAVFSDAVKISDSVTKADLKRALRKLVLPTRPKPAIMKHLEDEVLDALRAAGGLSAKKQEKVPVDEYRPKVVRQDDTPEEEAA